MSKNDNSKLSIASSKAERSSSHNNSKQEKSLLPMVTRKELRQIILDKFEKHYGQYKVVYDKIKVMVDEFLQQCIKINDYALKEIKSRAKQIAQDELGYDPNVKDNQSVSSFKTIHSRRILPPINGLSQQKLSQSAISLPNSNQLKSPVSTSLQQQQQQLQQQQQQQQQQPDQSQEILDPTLLAAVLTQSDVDPNTQTKEQKQNIQPIKINNNNANEGEVSNQQQQQLEENKVKDNLDQQYDQVIQISKKLREIQSVPNLQDIREEDPYQFQDEQFLTSGLKTNKQKREKKLEDWDAYIQNDYEKFLKEQLEKKLKYKENQKSVFQDLAKQEDDKRYRNQKQVQNEQQHELKLLNTSLQQMEQIEKLKKEHLEQKIKETKEIRQIQIQELTVKKQMEQQTDQSYNQTIIKKAQQDITDIEKEHRIKKMKERQFYEDSKKQEDDFKRKIQEQQMLQRGDISNYQFSNIFLQMQQKRNDDFQQRLRNIDNMQGALMNTFPMKRSLADMIKEDENKMIQGILNDQSMLKKEQEDKKRKQKEAALEMQEYYKQHQAKQQEIKNQAQIEKQRQLQLIQEQRDEYLRIQKEQEQKLNKNNKELASYLKKQMVDQIQSELSQIPPSLKLKKSKVEEKLQKYKISQSQIVDPHKLNEQTPASLKK